VKEAVGNTGAAAKSTSTIWFC